MNGLALARAYWERAGLPAFEARLPEALERAAVGLAGEGSECFGFDDDLSRDHDWGPGFCIWLTEPDHARLGAAVQELYHSLPPAFEGWPPRRQTPAAQAGWAVCASPAGTPVTRAVPTGPETLEQWRRAPEAFLAAAVNGAVFQDRWVCFRGAGAPSGLLSGGRAAEKAGGPPGGDGPGRAVQLPPLPAEGGTGWRRSRRWRPSRTPPCPRCI